MDEDEDTTIPLPPNTNTHRTNKDTTRILNAEAAPPAAVDAGEEGQTCPTPIPMHILLRKAIEDMATRHLTPLPNNLGRPQTLITITPILGRPTIPIKPHHNTNATIPQLD